VVARSLQSRILAAFVALIVVMTVMISYLGYQIIKRDIFDRAQTAVLRDLKAARYFYEDRIHQIRQALTWIDDDVSPRAIEAFRTKARLDYLAVVDVHAAADLSSDIVRAALRKRESVGGTRLLGADEMLALGVRDVSSRLIDVRPTRRARPTEKLRLQAVLTQEVARLVFNAQGDPVRVLYGGRIINQDFAIVDEIRELVFGNGVYEGKPIGTVTIFQDDVRVATNVLDRDGHRAVGTRVSEEVYRAVAEKGQTWDDRAFVVTDWYKTAYEPIRNAQGDIVGILYVGILEAPFNDMAGRVLVLFLVIVGGAAVMAVSLAFVLAVGVSRPLTDIVKATDRISRGDLSVSVNTNTDVVELNTLAYAFNTMCTNLKEREENLKKSNQSYVELISFVAHELKGMLASAIMNTYSVRDGFLGMINFKQRKAIDSVARNLDYLTHIVRKFLNLGRIERGDLKVSKVPLKLYDDVFKVTLQSLEAMTERKNLHIDNQIDTALEIHADLDMMQIVANNLISNAIKYSHKDGRIQLQAAVSDDRVKVEVYNDSIPISEAQRAKLFQKFSRLDNQQTKQEKGTGLGLFITRQIVEAHGGQIWVEPREQGNAFIFEIERG
jgi:two-component system NtrC family sensor kinase